MLIVDRIQGEIAICEDEFLEKVELLLTQIQSGVKEGDCLVLNKQYYKINHEETLRRRKNNALLLGQLLENSL